MCRKNLKFNKKKKFQGMLEEALTESMQVECPAQDCDYIMKGDFVDIIVDAERHFKRYHDNE